MHSARREGMFAFTIFFFLSSITEQILWFIKRLCTSLVGQQGPGVCEHRGRRRFPPAAERGQGWVLPAAPAGAPPAPRCRGRKGQAPRTGSCLPHQGLRPPVPARGAGLLHPKSRPISHTTS